MPDTVKESPKAGFWVRFFAFLIDSLILNLILFLFSIESSIAKELASILAKSSPYEELGSVKVLFYLAMLMINMGYFTYFYGSGGQSIGKMIFRLKVVGINGQSIGYRQAFWRWVGYLISGLFLNLGFLWILWDRNKQGWHDKIAGTYVQKIPKTLLFSTLLIIISISPFLRSFPESISTGI